MDQTYYLNSLLMVVLNHQLKTIFQSSKWNDTPSRLTGILIEFEMDI